MLPQPDHGQGAVVHPDLPAWIVTALGVCLGVLGLATLVTHPEPPTIWVLEGALIVVPAATLAYGGHWIATRSMDRTDRWVAAGWSLTGALVTGGFVTAYVLSERLSGSLVTEIEQLAIFGALSGSFVALLAVLTIQFQYRRMEQESAEQPALLGIIHLRTVRRLLHALRAGRIGGVAGVATEAILGRNMWMAYLKRFKTTDGLVPFEVHGITLFLDPGDPGISKDLLTYGSREETATAIVRRETERLRSQADRPITALDIGANLGYYTFQIADLLGDRGTVFAIEPEPNNVAALRRGISANQLENVSVEQAAVGATDGTEELLLSTRSSSHTLHGEIPDSKADDYRTAISVPVWTIASFLETRDLDPAEIDLVKVDVEGHEPAVLDAMAPVFAAGGPRFLFVELHPHRVDTSELHEIVSTIERHGFEIVNASSSVADDLPTYRAIREHVNTDDGSHTVELIVRKTVTE